MAFVFPLVSVTFDLRNIVCCLHFSKLLGSWSIISFPLEINFPSHYWIDQVCQKMSALTNIKRTIRLLHSMSSPKRQPNSNYTEYRLSRRPVASILLKEASASSNTKRLRKNEKPSVRPGVVAASRKCSSIAPSTDCTRSLPASHLALTHSLTRCKARQHTQWGIDNTNNDIVCSENFTHPRDVAFSLSRVVRVRKTPQYIQAREQEKSIQEESERRFSHAQCNRREPREEREGKSLPRGSDK